MNPNPKPFRKERLASIIHHELGEIITRELDIINAILTITKVEIIKHTQETARVHISITPYERGPEIYNKLTRAKGMLQFKLLRRMGTRVVPTLQFVIDEPEKSS